MTLEGGEPSAGTAAPRAAVPAARRLIAIVYADMVGYSALMGEDEEGTLARLRRLRTELITPLLGQHEGRLVQTGGDSFLFEFASITSAVRAAVALQRGVPRFDLDQQSGPIRFRIGINIADVLADEADIQGNGINVAARLQTVCPPGGLCVSRSVREHVGRGLDLAFEPLGELKFKNIARPIEAYVVRLGAQETAPPGATESAQGATRKTWWSGARAAMLRFTSVASRRDGGSLVVAMPDLNPTAAPRLSLVVMPFRYLGADAGDDYLADGITDDLTTDLSHIPDVLVTARGSAYTYRGRDVDPRQIGRELGVRYLVQGSVRRVGTALRVNVQLASTETGANLWTDRFDTDLKDLGAGHDEIVNRIKSALGVGLVNVELMHSARSTSADPDAFDLVLRARSLLNQPFGANRHAQARAFLEQALRIDPDSVPALVGLADMLTRQQWYINTPRRSFTEQAEQLVAAAERLQPASPSVMLARAHVLQHQEKWAEAIVAYSRVIALDGNASVAYAAMANCLSFLGQNEQAIPLYLRNIRLNPRDPNIWSSYYELGLALLTSERPAESITWFEQALTAHPDNFPENRAHQYRMIAAASILLDRPQPARAAMAEATRLSPWRTVRYYSSLALSPARAAQMVPIVAALRAAGMRDHADEDADHGVPSTAELMASRGGPTSGYTPVSVPGGRVLRTAELAELIAREKPLVLDINAGQYSLPGAVRLRDIGSEGASLDDHVQERLRRAMASLTDGDQTRTIVVVGWNAERWGGRNLALRLIALGYTGVIWYRGGREAWEVNGLPEEPVREAVW